MKSKANENGKDLLRDEEVLIDNFTHLKVPDSPTRRQTLSVHKKETALSTISMLRLYQNPKNHNSKLTSHPGKGSKTNDNTVFEAESIDKTIT